MSQYCDAELDLGEDIVECCDLAPGHFGDHCSKAYRMIAINGVSMIQRYITTWGPPEPKEAS